MAFAKDVTVWIGHHALGYDVWAINRLVPSGPHVDPKRVVDTLVVGRLFNTNLDGGHSLDAWGQRLGFPKTHFNDFSQLTDEMVEYCKNDVEVTHRLYKFFEPHIVKPEWRKALRTEHDAAIMCKELHDNGFYFNYEGAKELNEYLNSVLDDLSGRISRAFPPRARSISVVSPKLTRSGTLSRTDFRWLESGDLTPFSEGSPFTRIEWVPFNPGSPTQVVERFNEFGWKPFEKTDGHLDCERELRRPKLLSKERRTQLEEKLEHFKKYGWKVSEANLETLPEDAPEAAWLLVQWRMLEKRRQTLEEWFSAYNPDTHRIHGNFAHIGAWTGRMAHSGPNMGNVPSTDSKYGSQVLKDLAKYYGTEMRSLWTVPKGKRLVGVDADAIQLRILAHYMNDAEFTEALVNGDKDKGTDAHTLNAIKLGIGAERRPNAKTFIYAWLLGAGVDKVSKILHTNIEGARSSVDSFINGYPGLKEFLDTQIAEDDRLGRIQGLDGRLIKLPDKRHQGTILGGYLQGAESLIMKMAAIRWRAQLLRERVPFKLVNFVHDEWQTETEDDEDIANYVAQVQMNAIKQVGEELAMRCPLAGSKSIGYNWYETH